MAFFNNVGPTKLFTQKMNKENEFDLMFTHSEKNPDTEFLVQFKKGSKT